MYVTLTDMDFSLGKAQLGSKVVLEDEATSQIGLSRDETVRRVLEESILDCTVLVDAHQNQAVNVSYTI